MPEYVIGPKSLALFKKLQANRTISLHLAANAKGTSVGMVCGTGRALLKKLLKMLAEEAGGDQKDGLTDALAALAADLLNP